MLQGINVSRPVEIAETLTYTRKGVDHLIPITAQGMVAADVPALGLAANDVVLRTGANNEQIFIGSYDAKTNAAPKLAFVDTKAAPQEYKVQTAQPFSDRDIKIHG